MEEGEEEAEEVCLRAAAAAAAVSGRPVSIWTTCLKDEGSAWMKVVGGGVSWRMSEGFGGILGMDGNDVGGVGLLLVLLLLLELVGESGSACGGGGAADGEDFMVSISNRIIGGPGGEYLPLRVFGGAETKIRRRRELRSAEEAKGASSQSPSLSFSLIDYVSMGS